MTRYFYDCEFIEDGRTIDLLSIGIAADDGREYYAVSTECNIDRAGPWVRRNVLPLLPPLSSSTWKSRSQIRNDIHAFVEEGNTQAELWAWVGAYDHVALCQLWGDMTALPRHIPRFTRELKQRWEEVGTPYLPSLQGTAHSAIDDARHNLARALEMDKLDSDRH